MKAILTSFIFFLCLTAAVSQTNDSIRQEILAQPSSKLEILSKGRNYLLENLERGDLYKVKEIKDALVHEMDNDINEVFFPAEYVLILYWTEEYAELLSYLQSVDTTITEFRPDRLRNMLASTDNLYENISLKSAESYSVMTHFLDDASLTEVEKDFLELNLCWLLFGRSTGKEREVHSEVNDKADVFLTKHPNSAFEQIVRRSIRYKIVSGNWGGGCEIALGYAGMQGEMAKQFKDAFLFRLSLDGSYKKMFLTLNFNAGGSSTKVDFPYNETQWLKGSHAMMMGVDLTAGYRVAAIKKFSFMPFIGYGVINFSPGTKEIEEDKALKKLSFTSQNYLTGINFTYHYDGVKTSFMDGSGFLNLRYTFSMPQYDGRKGIEKGNMHWLTLGWGMYARPTKRVY